MPRAAAPARGNAVRSYTKSRATKPQAQANRSAKARTANPAMAGTTSVNPGTARTARTLRSTPTAASPYTYTYTNGTGSRSYRAYGYGRGYRSRSYGSGYGYGRSQRYNRAIVARLRSVHRNLARIDHDYQGHRVRAMHAVAMAIRQLSHRSMVYQGVGFAQGMNNGLAVGMGRGGNGLGRNMAAGRRVQRMPQAQSDARMSQALRTLQGIHMQLSQVSNTAGHVRAQTHVQHAIGELNIALSIR
jgi:hypothetical protein